MSVRAVLLPTPGVAFFNTSRRALIDCRARFFEQHEDPPRFVATSALAACDDLDDLQPMHTWVHELSHYRQGYTTAFGFGLWQIDLYLVDVALTALQLRLDPPPEALRGPRNIDEVLRIADVRLDVVARFKEALLGDAELNMGEFIKLAEAAHGHVADYWSTPRPRWRSKRPALGSYLPDPAVSTTEVLEGAARAAELNLWKTTDDVRNPGLLSTWEKRSLVGDYAAVGEALVRRVGDPVTAANLAEEALLAGVALTPGQRASFVVEDILPSWRLAALLGAADDVIFPWDPLERARACHSDLPSAARITPSVASLGAYASTDMAIPGHLPDPIYDGRYRAYVRRKFSAAMGLRERGLSPQVMTSLQTAEEVADVGGFQPVLEFYSDRYTFNDNLAQRDPMVLLSCYGELVRTVAGHAVLDGSYDLSRVRRAGKWVAADFADIVDGGLDPHAMVERLVGRTCADQFTVG